MMRATFVAQFFLSLCLPLFVQAADMIAPGVSLSAAKSTLQKYGYEVDSLKYGLAMAAPEGRELEFCPIDDNITLVIDYESSTRKVVSLGVVFIPDRITSKDQRVLRDVHEIGLYKDGIYTLKMKRVVKQASQSRK